MKVASTTAYVEGKRVVDKYHCCVFCQKLQLRIARHLQTVHKNETVVAQIMSKTDSKEREKGLAKLRLDGDYQYNIEVLNNNQGTLIVSRRPSATDEHSYSYQDFLPCEHCKGFYLRKDLWRHRQKCLFKSKNGKRTHLPVQSSSILLLESSLDKKGEVNEKFLENVVSKFIVDDISMIARNDRVILRIGEDLYSKHGSLQRQYISQEMRLLGRITKELREVCNNPNGYLEDFLTTTNFDNIVTAAQNLSKVETNEKQDTLTFKTPSVGLKCGPLLKKCCIALKGIAKRKKDDEKETDAIKLQEFIEDEWSTKVTSIALRSQKELKRNQQVLLPTTNDLLKLKDHIQSELQCESKKLQQCPTLESFLATSAAVLCRIMTFNRRRSGEVSKINLNDYVNRPNWKDSVNDEIMESLGGLEKRLVKRLVYVMVMMLLFD